MNNSRHSDPAERSALMRLFYRNWRPTRLGRWINRFMCWWSGLGLPPRLQAALEVPVVYPGRQHFPLRVGAPLSDFEAIAERYPVYRIEPS